MCVCVCACMYVYLFVNMSEKGRGWRVLSLIKQWKKGCHMRSSFHKHMHNKSLKMMVWGVDKGRRGGIFMLYIGAKPPPKNIPNIFMK